MNYKEHMYDHTYCWVQIPHYKSKPQINSNKYSPNLSINDTPKPKKVINTRERENNKTTLLSMRAQVITPIIPKSKEGLVTSHMRSTNKERVETNHGGKREGEQRKMEREEENQVYGALSPFHFHWPPLHLLPFFLSSLQYCPHSSSHFVSPSVHLFSPSLSFLIHSRVGSSTWTLLPFNCHLCLFFFSFPSWTFFSFLIPLLSSFSP